MNITPILFLLTTSYTIASCQKLPQAALASIMQEILSQSTPDQAAQIIKGAATRKIGIPEFTISRRSVIQEAGLPRAVEMPIAVNRGPAVVRNEGIPKTVLVQNTNEVVLPRNVVLQQAREIATPTKMVLQKPEMMVQQNMVVQNDMPRRILVQKANEGTGPMNVLMQNGKEVVATNKIIVKKPELGMPNKVLIKNPEVVNRNILVQKGKEIPMMKNLVLTANAATPNNMGAPKTVLVQNSNMAPQIKTVSEINVIPETLLKQPKIVEIVAKEKVGAVNPFLPAASPVSPLAAIAATTNSGPQPRGQFLRKIPIPPPTI